MTAICVDDEEIILKYVVSQCKKHPGLSEVYGFTSVSEMFEWLTDHDADIVMLDINMPEMNGIDVAKKLKEDQPDIAIIFLTGYNEYAVEAFSLHAAGYLLKPVNREKLTQELDHAIELRLQTLTDHVWVQTFGDFELYVDGKAVHFKRSKAKEVFAYLVDRQGAGVTRAQIFAALYEEGEYDRSMQKQLDVMIRSMRETLEEYGVSEIVDLARGELRVVPTFFSCDLYDFLGGKKQAKNRYQGEYMSAYPWATEMEGYITARA